MNKTFWENPRFDFTQYICETKNVAEDDEKEKISVILTRIENGKKRGFDVRHEFTRTDCRPRFASALHTFERLVYRAPDGDGYDVGVWFLARDTGEKDVTGEEILEADDGNRFVVKYWPGSPDHFGGLVFTSPKL